MYILKTVILFVIKFSQDRGKRSPRLVREIQFAPHPTAFLLSSQ